MSKSFKTPIFSFLILVLLLGLVRAFRITSYFDPLLACVLLGSLFFPYKRKGFYIPILSFLVVDVFLGFKDSYQVQLASYASLFFVFLLGSYGFKSFKNLEKLNLSSCLLFLFVVSISSCLFFISYSFCVWVFSELYSSNFLEVLKDNFFFLKYRILGDLFYSTLLFLTLHALKKKKFF